jgi:chromosome segregation ATPase
MQQDLEDEKNEATIKDLENKVESYEAALKKKDFAIQDLENKVKDHEAVLEKKDFVIHCVEGSLAEAQAEIDKLNSELLIKSEKSEQEKKNLETSLKTEIEKNSNLQKLLKELQEKCLDFGNRCVQRLKDVFTQLEPALISLHLQLKTCQAPLNTLRTKLMHLTKLSLGMPISVPC